MRKPSVLHIVISIGETNATYNEHCLPVMDQRDISICTFYKTSVVPPEKITLFEGDGSLSGFFRILDRALRTKSYDVIHAHSPHVALLFQFAVLTRHRRSLSSTVVTVHDSYQNFKFRNKLMFLPTFARFKRVICCGRASYESFPNLYRWLAGDRLGYVQNGLDIDRVDHIAASVENQQPESDEFRVIAISRLVDIKNPFTVLSSFEESKAKRGRLVYIGNGVLLPVLQDKTRESGLDDRVEFTGLIPRESVFEYLLHGDLFISASRGEGLPVAVMEAMACRRPVLLSDIPPHREIAEDVDFIPIINPDDTAGFASAIKNISEMSSIERKELGEKCRKLVEDRFSLTAMHAGYDQVYSQVMGPGVNL